MKKLITRNEQAVTLIELLAAITLLIIVMVPLTDIFLNGFKTSFKNEKQLDSKIVATGVIEELKVAVRKSKDTVEIAGKTYDVSNPDNTTVTDDPITINGADFLLTFSVNTYVIPDSMLGGVITVKPDDLYKIAVTLKPQGNVVNSEPMDIILILKK